MAFRLIVGTPLYVSRISPLYIKIRSFYSSIGEPFTRPIAQLVYKVSFRFDLMFSDLSVDYSTFGKCTDPSIKSSSIKVPLLDTVPTVPSTSYFSDYSNYNSWSKQHNSELLNVFSSYITFVRTLASCLQGLKLIRPNFLINIPLVIQIVQFPSVLVIISESDVMQKLSQFGQQINIESRLFNIMKAFRAVQFVNKNSNKLMFNCSFSISDHSAAQSYFSLLCNPFVFLWLTKTCFPSCKIRLDDIINNDSLDVTGSYVDNSLFCRALLDYLQFFSLNLEEQFRSLSLVDFSEPISSEIGISTFYSDEVSLSNKTVYVESDLSSSSVSSFGAYLQWFGTPDFVKIYDRNVISNFPSCVSITKLNIDSFNHLGFWNSIFCLSNTNTVKSKAKPNKFSKSNRSSLNNGKIDDLLVENNPL